MNEQERIRKALSGLRASEHTMKEVMHMAEQKKQCAQMRWRGKPALIAAALVILCVTTVFAADYAINRREVFFFDTIEAMASAQRTENPGADTQSYSAPASAEENRDMETVAQTIAVWLDVGYHGDETVLSDETDTAAETAWGRRRLTACRHDDYGQIWAEAVDTESGTAVRFYTTGCTTGELERILDDLQLAAVLAAGS